MDRREPQADFSWTRNLKLGNEPIGAVSLNGGYRQRYNNIDSGTRIVDVETGQLIEQTTQVGVSKGRSANLNGNARLRWKLSELEPQPRAFFALSQNDGSQTHAEGTRFRDNHGENDGRMHNLRLNLSASYRPQAGETWDLRRTRAFKTTNNGHRRDTQTFAGTTTQRLQDDHNTTEEDQTSLGAKWSLKTAKEHQWVTAASRANAAMRTQFRSTLVNGLPLPGLVRFGNDLGSRNQRFAPRRTNGAPANSGPSTPASATSRSRPAPTPPAALPETRNTSRVTSPLFHLLWKPEAYPRTRCASASPGSYRFAQPSTT